jgi:hypothetical protein
MEHSGRDRKFDAEIAAKGMERALFDCKPVLRSVWPDLSDQVRFDLFNLHRPDLASAYRIAIEALESRRTPLPSLRRH